MGWLNDAGRRVIDWFREGRRIRTFLFIHEQFESGDLSFEDLNCLLFVLERRLGIDRFDRGGYSSDETGSSDSPRPEVRVLH